MPEVNTTKTKIKPQKLLKCISSTVQTTISPCADVYCISTGKKTPTRMLKVGRIK